MIDQCNRNSVQKRRLLPQLKKDNGWYNKIKT